MPVKTGAKSEASGAIGREFNVKMTLNQGSRKLIGLISCS